ncbi:MAG TPA: glutaredoxin family protein [Polyangiales bacterium]
MKRLLTGTGVSWAHPPTAERTTAMPEICAKHNLVVAADGSCVLCRRAFSQRVLQRQKKIEIAPTLGNQILTMLLGAGLLAAATATYLVSQQPGAASAARALPSGAQPLTVPPLGDAGRTTTTATTTTPLALNPALNATPATAPSDLAAHSSVHSPIDRGALAKARAQVAITLYVTTWCFVCDWARSDLGRRALTYRELDVERDHQAQHKLAQLNPMASVPTFEIDGAALVGYGAWQLNDAIDRAAIARMRQSATSAPAAAGANATKPAAP